MVTLATAVDVPTSNVPVAVTVRTELVPALLNNCMIGAVFPDPPNTDKAGSFVVPEI